jgi:hypothetical protein
MDWSTILRRFASEIDVLLVAGIILIVMLVRLALSARKVELTDVLWRLIVAGAGILCGILKGNYEDGAWSVVRELLGSAVKYGGAATLIYQLGKPAIKALLGGESKPPVAPPPDQGIVG